MHAFNPSVQEAEADKPGPAWSTEQVPEQVELQHKQALSETNKQTKRHLFVFINICSYSFDRGHISNILYI